MKTRGVDRPITQMMMKGLWQKRTKLRERKNPVGSKPGFSQPELTSEASTCPHNFELRTNGSLIAQSSQDVIATC